MTTILAGAALRFVQASLHAAPTILIGLFVAAIMHCFWRREITRRIFGDGTWRSLLHAWLIGMLLPVCSLGVIPICREMRRARISGGTILAFAISAPLFNPLSLLYGLTLSEPFTILVFAFCSLVVVTAVGGLWDRLFPVVEGGREQHENEVEPEPVRTGVRRLLSLLVFCGREMTGTTLLYLFIGLAGVGSLAIFLPPGCLQRSLNGDNAWAPLVMTIVGIPAYATPMVAMGQLGSMFQHGNSVGAAFALLTLGAGMNLGLVAWMFANYGIKKAVAWIGMLVAVVLVLAYGVDKPLMPKDIEAADHSHAFDNYCQPFYGGEVNLASQFRSRLSDSVEWYEWYALIAVGVCFGGGLLLIFLERKWNIQAWLVADAKEDGERSAAWYERSIPAPVLGMIAIVMLVILSVVGCYTYYPEPKTALEEIAVMKTETLGAALAGQHKVAVHWLEQWDDWTRKLQVGVYLRHGELSDYHRMKARIVREKLELLEHELEEGDPQEIRTAVFSLSRSHMQLVRAFTTELRD